MLPIVVWILPSRKLRAECLNWEVACCCTKCTNPPYVTATVCKFEVFLGVVNAINVKLWKTADRSYYNYIVPYISYLTLIRFKVTVAWSSWNWDVPLVWVYVPCIYSQVRRELPWTIRVGMFIRRCFFLSASYFPSFVGCVSQTVLIQSKLKLHLGEKDYH